MPARPDTRLAHVAHDGARAEGAESVVCVVAPHLDQYSETFIQAHARELPAQVRRLYGGHLPTRVENGGRLLHVGERALAALVGRGRPEATRKIRERALERYLQRCGAAAVLAEYGPTGVRVLPACRRAGVPLVVHFHGADAYKERWLREYGPLYPSIWRGAGAVIATSREMEARLLGFGAPRERLFYNPCGADTSLFCDANPRSAPPTFLAVGRFVDKKAPYLTLQAFQRLLARCPAAHLTMVGDGPLWERCRALAGALRMAGSVEFTGALSPSAVAGRMRHARGFVQHSIHAPDGDAEGTPVSVLEAGAAGLPVVSTRHAGIGDVVVHGRTGFLTAEGDVDGMAQYWVRLANDPALAAEMGRAAQHHVRARFSLRMSIATLWHIIDSVIDGRVHDA